jgi:putative component of membrane protein insertase Oxa1/YidC/SpoIIIJ protein YidD
MQTTQSQFNSHPRKPRPGLIATIVGFMVPAMGLLERLGLKPMSQIAVNQAIRGYQTHLSPRKGFSCAHRRLYGDLSCSEYFRQAVLQYGFTAAVPMFQQRLDQCRQANHQLRASLHAIQPWDRDLADEEERQKRQKSNQRSNPNSGNDCNNWNCGSCDFPGSSSHRTDTDYDGPCDFGEFDLTPDCGGTDADGCDVGSCDMGGCDMGGCDVGSCDTGGCDCGS